MMKNLLLATLFCCVYSVAWSQTGEEEYLYLTFGYQEQLQKGLDDKKGYSWKPITKYKFTDKMGLPMLRRNGMVSSFDFEGLFREGEDTPCSIVCIYRKDENMKKRDGVFIPIPHHESGQDIRAKADEYLKSEVNFKSEVMYHYAIALGRLAIKQSQNEVTTQTLAGGN